MICPDCKREMYPTYSRDIEFCKHCMKQWNIKKLKEKNNEP